MEGINCPVGEGLKSCVGELIASLSNALQFCSDGQYTMPLPLLSGSTIGEHTRHIIGFFQCLHQGIAIGEVDYAKRERNHLLETDKDYALSAFRQLHQSLPLGETDCKLKSGPGRGMQPLQVRSGYYRELVYTIEHAIHHMAIIKIGLKSLQVTVDSDFGVAPSTLEYRARCVS